MFSRNACVRKSVPVSTTNEHSGVWMKIEERSRLSRGSDEWQTSQSQPIIGTPCDVPVPRKVATSSELSVEGGGDKLGKRPLSTVRQLLSTARHAHSPQPPAHPE